MEKQQIINFIEEQLAAGTILKSDLIKITEPVKEEGSKNLTNVFYVIGAIVAVIGVLILVAQNWNEIGFIGRIIVTLGISFGTYAFGLVLKNPEHKILSQVMFAIAAILAPVGSYVLLHEASIDFSWLPQLVTASLLFIIFGTALLISNRNILFLITVGYASWAYYVILVKIFGFGYFNSDYLKWASMLLGVSYILIAYGYKPLQKSTRIQNEKEKRVIQNVLYGFGTLAILGAGISIGGIFDLFLIIIIFGAFYGSVYLKSRSVLILGSLFLMVHIIKLTSKYFVDSTGWPVALIFVGFFVIGVGYMTFYLNNKFISEK